MNASDRLLDHIIKHTDKRFDEIHERMSAIDEKMRVLIGFRYQIIGGAVVVSLLAGAVVQIITTLITRT